MPKTINTFKEADSHYTFAGLKPLTTHYFYFNKKRQSSRVKQLGKKLGQPMISDENGLLEVIYYLDSGISSNSPTSASYKVPNLAAGVTEVVITTYDSGDGDLPDNYLNNSISSGKIIFGALRK
jgi:hypothetical protein